MFIVSFDTSSIPDGAVIQSATLQLTRGNTSGTDPFTTHGDLLVDIKNGSFGIAGLEISDFEAAASAIGVATVQSIDFTATLDAAGLANINKTGRTQLRIYFALDDNDDSGNDFAGFYSSDNGNSSRHPKLVINYTDAGV